MVPVHSSQLLFGLLVTLAAGCQEPRPECPEQCPPSQSCDPESALCRAPADRLLDGAALALTADGTAYPDGLGVMTFDQVRSAFFFGWSATPAGPFEWEFVAAGAGLSPTHPPAIGLVRGAAVPVACLEQAPGRLVRLRRNAGGWQEEGELLLKGPAATVKALQTGTNATHLVATDLFGRPVFSAWEGGSQGAAEPLVAANLEGVVQGPVALVRVAGRTTVLAHMENDGLLSLVRNNDLSFSGTVIVPEAQPLAISAVQSGAGLVALYLDQRLGTLMQVVSTGDTVAVGQLQAGPAPTGALSPGLLRLATAAGGDDRAWLAFFDHGTSRLELCRMVALGEWQSAGSWERPAPSLPMVLATADGAVAVAAVEARQQTGGAPAAFALFQVGP